jgi:hypothetical protein
MLAFAADFEASLIAVSGPQYLCMSRITKRANVQCDEQFVLARNQLKAGAVYFSVEGHRFVYKIIPV